MMFDEDFFLDEDENTSNFLSDMFQKEYKPENYMISDENNLVSDNKEHSQSRKKSNISKTSSQAYRDHKESYFQDVLQNSAHHSKHNDEKEEPYFAQQQQRSEFISFFENLHIDSDLAKNYYHALTEIGFDNVTSLQDAKENELLDIGIKLGHARQIKRAVSTAQNRFSQYNIPASSKNDGFYHQSVDQNYTVYDKDVYHDASLDEDRMHDASFEENSKPYPDTKNEKAQTNILEELDSNNYNNDLNTTLDASTCPDEMEYARLKIKRMAAKIRSLETQLTAKSNSNGSTKVSQDRKSTRASTGSNNEKNSISPKKIVLSKEERLKAHLRRKSQENKYKESILKFDKDSPIEKPASIAKNVKKNDDMVDRLTTANISERRHHDKIKKKMKKRLSLIKSENTSSPEETSSKSKGKNIEGSKKDNQSQIRRNESAIKQSNSSSSNEKKNEHFDSDKDNIASDGKKKVTKREALMARLAMSAKERRNQENLDIPANVQRAIQGHTMKKKTWNMSENYASENEDTDGSDEEHYSSHQKIVNDTNRERTELLELATSRSQFSCATCNSEENCEEDIDDPGTFYCQRCWDEYDVEDSSDLERPASPTHLMPEDKPHKLISINKKKRENEAIWMVHDNSLLGRNVSIGMKCLLETKDKDDKDTIRLVTGVIDFSGSVIKSGLDSTEEIEKCDLGLECFRLRNALGYIVNRNNVKTRQAKSGNVTEIQMDESDGIVLTTPQTGGKNKTQSTLKDFFHGCDGAIDVILEPQQSTPSWYPLWDTETEKKIAPHFRSKGVGYIRLGDDMSKYGAAFLSCDECQSFLSSVPSISSPSKNRKVVKKPTKKKNDDNKAVVDRTKNRVSTQSNTDRSPIHEKQENIDELLKKMQNDDIEKEMTWQEKSEIIKLLGKSISLQQDGETYATASLTMLQNIVCSKNVNLFVLRTSILSIAHIGQRIKQEFVTHISWRAIMAELLKLLKNKQVSTDVKHTLTQLHKECFRLSNVLGLISQTLGFGKTTVNGNSSSPAMGSTRRTSSGGGNNNVLEILDWLSEAVWNEYLVLNCATNTTAQLILDKCGILTFLKFFISHLQHRDPKCRKYVENGIVNSIVYGVDQNIVELESFTTTNSVCGEVKASNPRMWKAILSRITVLLDEKSG